MRDAADIATQVIMSKSGAIAGGSITIAVLWGYVEAYAPVGFQVLMGCGGLTLLYLNIRLKIRELRNKD